MKVGRSLTKDGMVEYLVSPGYGAAWSADNPEFMEFLLFDPELIRMCKENTPIEEVEEYVKNKTWEKYFFMGGWGDCVVETKKPDERIRAFEYDGTEWVEFYSPKRYFK